MRRITRTLVLAILGIVAVLLALGAVPSLIRWGDPYYLTVTPVVAGSVDATVDVTELPERRFPYATAALENATADDPGRSHPYWRGPVGFKEAFAHSPFDELDALAGTEPNATVDDGDAVFVERDGEVYRLAVEQEGGT